MSDYRAEQEAFWAGGFGKAYMERNRGTALLASKTTFFGRALRAAPGIQSICEFGCNIGLNLKALSDIGNFDLNGIEINADAAEEARALGVSDISTRSILEDMSEEGAYDLAFTAGVLIHINPEYLNTVYDNLVRLSGKYVMVAEYYNPAPVSVSYRGHGERLYKRDFAGELMERHALELVDYGFVYRRDNYTPMDYITWFLLRKPQAKRK
nr:pseudaminic acid biosynthesis-associated methylase [uncultured Roseovarius sp.]